MQVSLPSCGNPSETRMPNRSREREAQEAPAVELRRAHLRNRETACQTVSENY